MGCIAVTWMEPHEPTVTMMVYSHVPPPPPEPISLQISSTTFEAEGVHLGPKQLKELKVLATKWEVQRSRATADKVNAACSTIPSIFSGFVQPLGICLSVVLPTTHVPRP